MTFPGPFSRSHISLISSCLSDFVSQVKEAMQRIHDRGNIGKLILDVEKTPTPLVSGMQRKLRVQHQRQIDGSSGVGTNDEEEMQAVYRLSKTRGDQMIPE